MSVKAAVIGIVCGALLGTMPYWLSKAWQVYLHRKIMRTVREWERRK